MNEDTEIGGFGLGVDWLEGAQAEDVPRIYRVRIAQPCLDLRHGELARAGGDRRAGRGRLNGGNHHGRIQQPLPIQQSALCARISRRPSAVMQRGAKSQQPSARHRRGSLLASRAGEPHLGCRERLAEIVGRQAYSPLRQGQPEGLQHRPAHPGAGLRLGRPTLLVEAAEDHHVRALQPRFQWTPDGQARMPAPGRPNDMPRHQGIEQLRIVRQRNERVVFRRLGQLREEARERVTGIARPQPLCSGLVVGRGKRLRGRHMRRRGFAKGLPRRGRKGGPVARSRLPVCRSAPARARRSPWASAATAWRSPVIPGAGRSPRSARRSSARTRRRNSETGWPPAASGCFSAASSGTGAISSTTMRAIRRRNAAGGGLRQRLRRRSRRR